VSQSGGRLFSKADLLCGAFIDDTSLCDDQWCSKYRHHNINSNKLILNNPWVIR